MIRRAPNRAGRGTDRDERGVVAVLTVILVLVLLVMMAYVSDIGMAYANQRRLQTGADAAALAVGRKIAVGAGAADNCATIKSNYNTSFMRSYAAAMLTRSANAEAGLSAGTDGFDVTCESVGSNVETLVVKVKGAQNSPTFLGKLFGQANVPVAEQARAIVAPMGSVVGLRPFAVCQGVADLIKASPGTVLTYSFDNADQSCGYAAGNWGVMDFNGGSNPTGEVADWIVNGYNGEISNAPPVYFAGNPGAPNPGALDSEMDTMMTLGDIVLPVYDNVSGSGNGSKFRITGFISVTACGWKFNNKSGNNPTCFVAPPSPVPKDYLQVKFSKFIPVGSLSLTCRLGDHTCDGDRGVALAD